MAYDTERAKWPDVTDDGYEKTTLATQLAGEEQTDSKYNSQSRVTEDWKWKRVNLSADSTEVCDGPCRLGVIRVETAMSAHACVIKNGTDTYATLAASSAAGTVFDFGKFARFTDSLVIDPDNSGTGVLLVHYSEAKFAD